jgi:hypothetical protein
MKYLMSLDMRAGQDAIDPEPARAIQPDPRMEPTPTMEELGGADPVRATSHADRWLGLAIAVGTAVICFGFTGRTCGPLPINAAAIESPASEPSPNLVHATAAPGLALDSTELHGNQTLANGVVLTYIASRQTDGGLALSIDGHASSTHALRIEVQTPSGRRLASMEVPITADDERPGSGGRGRVGAGSFHQQIVVPGPIPPAGSQVAIVIGDGGLSTSGDGRPSTFRR